MKMSKKGELYFTQIATEKADANKTRFVYIEVARNACPIFY